MKSYQLSRFFRSITDSETGLTMVYHSLFGNPQIVNEEGVAFFELFRVPLTHNEVVAACDGDPSSIIAELAGIHLLIEPGFDERGFLEQQRQQHLAQVVAKQTIDRMGLSISDFCNLGCPHCIHFQPSSNQGAAIDEYQKPAKHLLMTWETAKVCLDRFIELLRENGVSTGKIHFGNAEPLVNCSVVEAALYYCDGISDISFEYTINTNLTLLTPEIAETLKKYGVSIATSLDGTRQANDAIRTTLGGQGTYDLIIRGFDLLATLDYPLDGFSITVTEDNFHLIDIDIIDLAHQRGMTSIAFDYDLVGLIDIPIKERVDKLMRLKRYADERGIEFFGTWDSVFRNLTSESLLTGTHAFCAAVEGRALEFNIDGSIKMCGHTTATVGHVEKFDQVFPELCETVKKRYPGTDEYCYDCDFEGSCGGQCQVTREVVSRSTSEEHQSLFSAMCDFYRTVTETLAIEHIRSHGIN